MRTVLHLLHAYIQRPAQPGENEERVSRYARYSWLLGSITDEVLDEMAENGTEDATIGMWIEQMGKVIQWCGSGDDSVLPDEIQGFLGDNYRNQLLAITAGGDD